MICMQRSAHSCEICVELLAGISVLEYAFCTRHNSPLSRKDCCGVYIMDENRLNEPYNSLLTNVLQYIVPHQYFQYFAR